MSKQTKAVRGTGTAKTARKDWPLVIYVWIIGLGLTGYFIGRIALDAQPHPWHWAAGLMGAVIGYFIGWGWYRWRGDIC